MSEGVMRLHPAAPLPDYPQARVSPDGVLASGSDIIDNTSALR